MVLLDLLILGLLGTAVVFSIIELGLSAYIVSIGVGETYTYWDPNYAGDGYGGYQFGTRTASAPAEVDFLLFCSLWTLGIATALILVPLVLAKRNQAAGRNVHVGFSMVTLAVTALAMIFWLAGFAALAHLYNGASPQDIPGALLAFAVLLWLIFLALLVLNILTAFNIVKSERLGHHPMFARDGTAEPGATSNPAATNDTAAAEHLGTATSAEKPAAATV